MHHSRPTPSSCGRCMHSQHNPCPTELTCCGEGSMTRERSASWGDMNEKRNGNAPPCSLPKLQFLFSFMSPHHALLSLVMLPSPAASEFGWARGCAGCACTGRMRTLWVRSGAWECPPCALPRLVFLFSFMSPHHALPSFDMFPSPQGVSSVGQGLCWLCMHRPHEDVVGSEWCMGRLGKGCPRCACTGRMRTLWVRSGAWECPPLCTSLTCFLFSFMSPHHALLSLVVLPSPRW